MANAIQMAQAGTSDMTVDIVAVPTMKASTTLRVLFPDLVRSQQAKRLSNPVCLYCGGKEEHGQHEKENRADEETGLANRCRPDQSLPRDRQNGSDGYRQGFGNPQTKQATAM